MNLARIVDCLDHDTCDLLINADLDYKPSRVLKAGTTKVDPIRTSSYDTLRGSFDKIVHPAINEALLNWSKQIASEYDEAYTCALYLPGVSPGFDTWRENVQILKYEQGEHYKWHVDQSVQTTYADEHSLSRCVSVVVYLNDDFKGGETEMPDCKFRPKKGKALVFPSNWNYPHRACPVEDGTKYALVTWFHPSN
jgi:hypothetical protein